MAKRMLADVLWDAANRRLAATYDLSLRRVDVFSCNAVGIALEDGWGCCLTEDVREFLQSLGCSGSAVEIERISGLPCGPSLQGVRYMWLLLAACVAEDEGMTV
jgi:hypothetical protein